jgi:hypothetical protein
MPKIPTPLSSITILILVERFLDEAMNTNVTANVDRSPFIAGYYLESKPLYIPSFQARIRCFVYSDMERYF